MSTPPNPSGQDPNVNPNSSAPSPHGGQQAPDGQYAAPTNGAGVPKKKKGPLKWLLGGCGLIVVFIVLIAACAAVFGGGGGGDESTDTTPAQEETTASDADAEEEPAEDAPAEEAPAEEEAATSDKFTIAVSGVERASSIGDEFIGEEAQGEFVIVTIDYTNTGSEQVSVSSSDFKLVGSDGTEYGDSSDALMGAGDLDVLIFEDVNPGSTLSGKVLVFDVPEGTEASSLRYSPLFSFETVETPIEG